MSNSYTVRTALRRSVSIPALLAMVATLSPLASLAKNEAESTMCIQAYPGETVAIKLNDWNQLPSIITKLLPPHLLEAMAKNETVRALQERYGSDAEFAFELAANRRGDRNGWGIQGELLVNLLRQIFPKSEVIGEGSKQPVVKLLIGDSIVSGNAGAGAIDMTNLKILNPGPILADQAILRTQLNLPKEARIASIYYSWTQEEEVASVVSHIMRAKKADIIILSSQSDGNDGVREELNKTGLSIITSTKWSKLNRKPSRAVIINETRGRMPLIHRAADYAVVLGMANIMEPTRAERPTYFTKLAPLGFHANTWESIGRASKATGFGHPVRSTQDLLKQLSEPAVHPESQQDGAQIQEQLNAVLQPVLRALMAAESR